MISKKVEVMMKEDLDISMTYLKTMQKIMKLIKKNFMVNLREMIVVDLY